MKYLRLFEAASDLFPKRIKVVLIDAVTGNSLGKYRISSEILPAAFNRPITLEIDKKYWRVLHANPVSAEDFLFSKKLTLQVLQQLEGTYTKTLKFNEPTIWGKFQDTGTDSLFQDFTIEMSETNWRQIEFWPLSQSGIIEKAIQDVERILNEQQNPLLGYDQQYIRGDKLKNDISILFDEFSSLLANPVYGNILFNSRGFVQDGFAIRTDSYIYYGIMDNGIIHTLCLTQFDWADDEFMRVLSAYGLLLADWCRASRLTAEAGDEPQNEFVKI